MSSSSTNLPTLSTNSSTYSPNTSLEISEPSPFMSKVQNQTSTLKQTKPPNKVVTPTFIMYKDPIIEQYTGKSNKEFSMPKTVVSTLVRGTISNTITGCQGIPGRSPYPYTSEVAKHLCEVYPCLVPLKTDGKLTKVYS
uniref:Uncharacterized protein n=1 Tax=Clytia hemisphaerica TaxID=252671 RepID=A0A7M5XKT0_9CNID